MLDIEAGILLTYVLSQFDSVGEVSLLTFKDEQRSDRKTLVKLGSESSFPSPTPISLPLHCPSSLIGLEVCPELGKALALSSSYQHAALWAWILLPISTVLD